MDRPRRTIRQPVKAPQLIAEPPPRATKRKATPEYDPERFLKNLLESSKSDLVSLDMNDIINQNTWFMLSEESRSHLKTFLPPTTFTSWQDTLGSDHPSLEDEMVVDSDTKLLDTSLCTELKPGFFTDPHFLAAARSFQDHLYLNWFSDSHIEKVKKFQEGIINGTMAAPWKDEVWERNNPMPEPQPASKDIEPSSSFTYTNNSRAGGASEIKMSALAKNNILRVGDVIAYRRSFATSEVIEKDSIIESIHPKTFALTIITAPGTTKDLPQSLLAEDPTTSSESTLSMIIFSPTQLETVILDTDGRMEKSRRPHGNAWKTFSVWRWRSGGGYSPYESRGGRENHGTLFYLRGSFYHEN